MRKINSKDNFLSINISEEEVTKYKFMNYYNNISFIKPNYILNCEICSEASFERIEYYAERFKNNNMLKKSLLQLNEDDDEMVTLGASIDNENSAEYIILSTRRINNYRKIIIIEFKKENKISKKFLLFNGLGSCLLYTIFPTYKITSSLVAFFSKGFLDYHISDKDISKIAILKYLENNKYINIDVENKRIRLNI